MKISNQGRRRRKEKEKKRRKKLEIPNCNLFYAFDEI